ncbi:MAG: hypothetical protein F4123_00860 [Gemmatimonadetes bacterium]|nr:hypothetical protein [Gemmatimonadota bacterium]MYB97324.1 hypothetical protein [Gemmatimonadota bacterium]MYI44942.1 hypothetical protein [Gemmatimonadota bacterium]
MTLDNGPVSSRLLELQTMDRKIRETRDRIDSYDPKLAEVEAPAIRLAGDVDVTENRVRDLRLEERRLRLAAEEKQARVHRLEERLNLVRTVREEAAVQAELGLVRRALDQEEQEVVNLLDQISRFEARLEDQRSAMEEARLSVGPRRDELLAERELARAEVASLEARREEFASEIDPRYLRAYDHLAQGGRRVAVAPMTEDGACGSCFSVIPLQVQNEIRTRAPLVRCEACGVIVTAPAAPAESGSPSLHGADASI